MLVTASRKCMRARGTEGLGAGGIDQRAAAGFMTRQPGHQLGVGATDESVLWFGGRGWGAAAKIERFYCGHAAVGEAASPAGCNRSKLGHGVAHDGAEVPVVVAASPALPAWPD